MKFLIQWNLMNENSLQLVKNAVKDYPHEFIEVIPFSRDIVPKPDGNDYIPYGSTLMTTIGLDYNWSGLHFDLSKFNYGAARKNRDDMLNSFFIETLDNVITFLLSSPHYLEIDWFIRPSEDLKQFSGQIMNGQEIVNFLTDAKECASSGSYHLSSDTMIVLDTPQEIQAEWRWFVVAGKIISGSMYRFKGQLHKARELDVDVINEAQTFADKWLPNNCCVMDLALVDDKLKVIEFNCINASGFYDHDVDAIFKALWEYHERFPTTQGVFMIGSPWTKNRPYF
jgi:hypothetical protein